MVALADKKTIGEPFSNTEELARSRYSFASDTGAQATYDIIEADGPIVVTSVHAVVKTTATSGGSATLTVGITGSAAYLVASTAVAGLTANAVLRPVLTEGTPNVAKV